MQRPQIEKSYFMTVRKGNLGGLRRTQIYTRYTSTMFVSVAFRPGQSRSLRSYPILPSFSADYRLKISLLMPSYVRTVPHRQRNWQKRQRTRRKSFIFVYLFNESIFMSNSFVGRCETSGKTLRTHIRKKKSICVLYCSSQPQPEQPSTAGAAIHSHAS